MSRILLAVLGTALVGSGALATGPASTEKDKLVCRTESAVGSRLAKTRTCKTAAEWAELRRQQSQNVSEIQQRRGARLSDDPPSMGGFNN